MSVGILVPSYDGYADIWPIQAQLLQRFWPEREWPMYWLSNGAKVPDMAKGIFLPRIQRTEWGRNVEAAVRLMPHDRILFWFDEIFPLSKIPHDLFLEAAAILATLPDVGIVQLTRYYCQPQTATVGNFTDYPREETGFSSSLPAIFRKDVLLHLLRTLPKSNDFEQQSKSVLFRDMPQVRSLISTKPMFWLCDNALLAGPWRKCAVKHLGELGIEVDFTKRGISPDECSYMDGVPA